MDDDEILLRAKERMGTDDDDVARRALGVAMTLLAEMLSAAHAESVAKKLSPGLAAAMERAAMHDVVRDAEAVARKLSRRAGLAPGRGREAALAVYGLLPSTLDADTIDKLRRELDPSVAELFAEHEPLSAPVSWHRSLPKVQRISIAQPGSSHPIASGKPLAPRPHEQRIAVAHGTSRQEMAGETLARARRGETVEKLSPSRHGRAGSARPTKP